MRKRIKAGSVLEIAEYYTLRVPKSIQWPDIGKKLIRGKNRSVSSEKQRKLNSRHAALRLGRLINANFSMGDVFATFDFNAEPLFPTGECDMDAVIGMMQKLIRKLRREYKKAGVTFKYIAVIEKATEQGKKRVHIHMFVPSMSWDVIKSCWAEGGTTLRGLDATKDYKKIANYLSKDPTLGTNHKKRWYQSKNLTKPQETVRQINHPGDYIKTPPGYKEMDERVYWSDDSGLYRYIRYVKVDGADFARQIIKDGMPDGESG